MYFRDNSGNHCEGVVVGKQTWITTNLAAGHFRNGDAIPLVSSDEEWEALGDAREPAACFYRNDPALGTDFGLLYNWFAVNDPRGLAPEGWRIPYLEDWKEIIATLGGGHIAGRRLKDRNYWNNNGNGNNESGFCARPGGGRGSFGSFLDLGDYGNWWTSTETSLDEGCFLYLTFIDSSALIRTDGFKASGLSVRCIRNQE